MVLEKTLESPLDCKEIQPVHPKGDQSWGSLEGLMLKLKLLFWPPDAKSQLIGHESEQTLGDSKEQGNLVGCISRGHKESDKT